MHARPAATFLALASAAALAAWGATSWAARGAAGASAVAFTLVAIAYARDEPRLLLKHPGGRRRAWGWPVLGPFWLLCDVSLALCRLGGRPAFVQVAPNLFLGRRLTAREARSPAAPDWHAVLDLAAELPEAGPLRTRPGYRSLPVLDARAPGPDDLASAVDWLIVRSAEGPVYVHCALGHGRSATVVVAYLMATGRVATIDEGIDRLARLRPGVGLSAVQRDSLRRLRADAAGP